jgi:TP901 family phage tail tape measure protein
MEKMQLIARAAQASGADVNDMAQLMFTLTENMKVAPTDLEATIGGLINQAKDGSIHFKELSKELVALGPVYSQFGVTGRQGAIQLGAMMQVARRGFGSASEAGTGVLRILRSLPQHASKFRKFGVEVFKPGSKTDLDTFDHIFNKIRNSKLKLDREALIKAFGRTEGERFYQLLVMANDEYQKLIEAGKMNGVVTGDLGTFTESTSGRIDRAVEKMKNAFAQALTPERVEQIVGGIQRMADAMPALMGAVGRVSDAFSAFIHMVAKAKNAITGGSHYEDSDMERSILQGHYGDYGLTAEQGDRKRAQILARDAQYNKAIDQIMGAENDFGATDESIRRALRVAMPYGPDHRAMPGSGAGVDYLAGRSGEITTERLRRLRSEIEDERSPKGFGYNPTEKYETKLAEETVRRLAEAIARAVSATPPVVNMDGNKVSSAVHGATNARRR